MNEQTKSKGKLSLKFGAKHWSVLLYTTVLYFVTAIITGIVQIVVPGLTALRGWNYATLMSFNTIGGLLSIPVTFIFAQIIKSKGVKWPTFILLVLYGGAMMLYGSPIMLVYMIAVLVANAVSNGLNMVSPNTLLTDWFPKKKGVVLGIATAGMMLSAIVAAPVFQVISNGAGLPNAFLIVGAVILVVAVLTLFIKNTPQDAGTFPDNDPGTDLAEVARIKAAMSGRTGWTIGRLLKNKDFWMITLGFGLGFFALIGAASFFMSQGIEYGLTQPRMLVLMMLSGIGSVIGSYILGAIDQAVSTKLATVIYGAGMIVGMATRALGVNSMPLFYIGVFCLPFFQGGLANLMISMTIQVFGPASYASVNRIMSPLVIAIRTLSFVVVGVVYTRAGTYSVVSWVITALLVLSFVFLCCINGKTKAVPGLENDKA